MKIHQSAMSGLGRGAIDGTPIYRLYDTRRGTRRPGGTVVQIPVLSPIFPWVGEQNINHILYVLLNLFKSRSRWS